MKIVFKFYFFFQIIFYLIYFWLLSKIKIVLNKNSIFWNQMSENRSKRDSNFSVSSDGFDWNSD